MDNKKRDLHTISNRVYPVSDYLADRLVKYKNDSGFKNYQGTFEHLLALGIREQEAQRVWEERKHEKDKGTH